MKFITQHSELNLTDTQVEYVKELYKWNYRLNVDQKVDMFVTTCMNFGIEPMDMLKLVVPFEQGFTEPAREIKL